MLTTFDLPLQSYRLNRLRYDLRKLKGHALLERDGRRYSYRLTSKGLQVALLIRSSTSAFAVPWLKSIPGG